jgi:hypothetical protein
MASPPPLRRSGPAFRPRFTLMLVYLLGFFLLFGLLFALPDLIAAARELPPGGELTPEELEQARDVARSSLRGRIPVVFACAFLATALGAWRRLLPGLRE